MLHIVLHTLPLVLTNAGIANYPLNYYLRCMNLDHLNLNFLAERPLEGLFNYKHSLEIEDMGRLEALAVAAAPSNDQGIAGFPCKARVEAANAARMECIRRIDELKKPEPESELSPWSHLVKRDPLQVTKI